MQNTWRGASWFICCCTSTIARFLYGRRKGARPYVSLSGFATIWDPTLKPKWLVPHIGPVFVSFYRAEQEGVDGYPVGEKSTRGSGMLTVKEDGATT